MFARFHFPVLTALFCACITLLSASPAFAGFDATGHENFSGSALDTATWEQYPPGIDTQYGVFTQNNKLTIDTTGPVTLADYTTRAVQVPIGGSVSATVTPGLFTPSGGGIWIYLTDNSGGENIQANLDHKRIAMSMPFSDGNVFGGAGSDQNGYGNFVAQNLPTSTPFVWSIERFSATSGRFSVRTTGGQLMGSFTDNNLTWPNISFNEPLYISLQTAGTSATFSNVSFSIPEPAALSAIAFALLPLTRRRQQVLPIPGKATAVSS